jgi:hypothetical protein
LAFGLGLRPQRQEHVELRVQRLGPEARAAVRQLRQPRRPRAAPVHAPAGDRDRARPEERLQPQHHPRGVLDEIRVRPRQLAQRRALRAPVVDRPEVTAEQPPGEHIRVDHVGLGAAVLAAPVADDDLVD